MVWPLLFVAGKAAMLAKAAFVGKTAVGAKAAVAAKGAMAGKAAVAGHGAHAAATAHGAHAAAAAGHGAHAHGAAALAAKKVKSFAVDVFSDQMKARIKQISIARGDDETTASAKADAAEFAFQLVQGDWIELVKTASGHFEFGRKLNPKDALAKCFNKHM